MSESRTGLYFLLTVILIYLAVVFFSPESVLSSLGFSFSIAINIIPVFVLVFALMIAVNYYITPEIAVRYLGRSSGMKKWIIAVFGGIISIGPIYMWYPMLKELKKKGIGYSFIAVFLYNRAVKIPLIPLLIFYFGIEFTIVLTIVMIIMSLVQGLIFERLEGGML